MRLTLKSIIKKLLKESVADDLVFDAIHNKYFVRIKYDDGKNGDAVGDPKGSRLIQPMAIGKTKKGNLVVRAFQFDGNSRKGAPNWKYFRLDRITSWKPMPNKHFNEIPDARYGEYNKVGDRSMGEFFDNAKFDDFTSPLDMLKNKNDMPKMSTKNVKGPISADKQWKKNVFTSQPNSSKYAQYAKNVNDTEDETDRFNDDIWQAAEKEREAQNNQQGPIGNTNNYDYNENDFDTDEVDFDENEFKQNNNRR